MGQQSESLTRQLLFAVRQAVRSNGAGLDTVQSLAASLKDRVRVAYSQFAATAPGNPEASEASVQRVLEAFLQFDRGLEAIGLAGRNLAALESAAAAVEAASDIIRHEQDAYEATLQALGPTPFPDVNRVLLHLRHLYEGSGHAQFALLALAGMEGFQTRTGRDLSEREMRGVQGGSRYEVEAAARDAEQLCLAAASVLATGWPLMAEPERSAFLGSLHQDLEAAAAVLSQALAGYVEAEAAGGPTCLPMANLVLQAADNLQQGVASTEDFVRVVEEAQTMLDAWRPGDQLDLYHALDFMRRAALQGDLDAMLQRVPDVHVFADRVALAGRYSARAWDDDEVLFDFVHGMEAEATPAFRLLPGNLQAAVDAAAAYLSHPADPTSALQALAALQGRVQAARTAASRMKASHAVMAPLHSGLDALDEAVASLRYAIDQHRPDALEAARTLMHQASEVLSGIS